MGWEAQVSTPCPAYPRKPRPRMKSAMTEYSLRTKQILQSSDLVTDQATGHFIRACGRIHVFSNVHRFEMSLESWNT